MRIPSRISGGYRKICAFEGCPEVSRHICMGLSRLFLWDGRGDEHIREDESSMIQSEPCMNPTFYALPHLANSCMERPWFAHDEDARSPFSCN